MSKSGISPEPEMITCPMCNRIQNCDVLCRLEKSWAAHGGAYSILECRGCNQVFYQTVSWDGNDFDLWNDESGTPVCELNRSESIYPAEDKATPSQSQISKGGRLPVADWEAAMVEMARALYSGDLKPKTQADIERAIADYLSKKEKNASESTIREHARPLWQAIGSKD